ncbi:MAG TPA: hypothetical protein VEP68_00280 [Anaeromyxobacteraceae bacterium]|nr:hypothetical protein [Anaeromyxobacteraceae bacterium]
MATPGTSETVEIAHPATGPLRLSLAVGACRLTLKPGDAEPWVAGSYADPSGALPYKVSGEGGSARISQEARVAEMLGLFKGAPVFDLRLGSGRPFDLSVESGASDNVLELGGLPLTGLVLRQGAGKLACRFSAPNPAEMAKLEVEAGAVGLEIAGLGHANFGEMRLDGGAAAYDLDFSGALRRDGRVRISTGVSAVTLRIPAATAAKVFPEAILGGLDVGDGFTKKEGAFCTQAALAGGTPVLIVEAKVALGSLALKVV